MFKDWGNHKFCLTSPTPGPTDQTIGTGDGATTAFLMVKRYASDAESWTRSIAKPVADNDVMRGGIRADTVVFRVGSGNDRMADFGKMDPVEIEAALLGGGAPEAPDLIPFATRDASGFLLLEFGNGDTLTFTDITNTSAILGDVSFL